MPELASLLKSVFRREKRRLNTEAALHSRRCVLRLGSALRRPCEDGRLDGGLTTKKTNVDNFKVKTFAKCSCLKRDIVQPRANARCVLLAASAPRALRGAAARAALRAIPTQTASSASLFRNILPKPKGADSKAQAFDTQVRASEGNPFQPDVRTRQGPAPPPCPTDRLADSTLLPTLQFRQSKPKWRHQGPRASPQPTASKRRRVPLKDGGSSAGSFSRRRAGCLLQNSESNLQRAVPASHSQPPVRGSL